MIKKINNNPRGQAALILILVTAAALIFLAITYNWGHIAQTKAMVTIAADQAAALLASDAASYGELQKQTYLQNMNQISSLSGTVMAAIAIFVAVVCLIITITTVGAGSGVWVVLAIVLAAAAVVMAVVNFALQLCVVQPGITSLWNKLQKSQPIQQQFYEQGLATALEGAVTDRVNITDYFDLNTNGVYGMNWTTGFPNDTIGRFAFFYTDRLRMIYNASSTNNSQIGFFLNQLSELMNGETCAQNASDHFAHPGIALNPACPSDCLANPSDTGCQTVLFQLNDACTDSNYGSLPYSPYCDPCCQPLSVKNPNYDQTNPLQPMYKVMRPADCAEPGTFPGDCNIDPSSQGCAIACNNNPSYCTPPQCIGTSNPYGPSYSYLYDMTFQEYLNKVSFLDLFGRDEQFPTGVPFSSLLTAQGASSAQGGNNVYFPNGIYPFFWMMQQFSPEVDNITPATLTTSPDQVHWCSVIFPGYTAGVTAPSATTLQAFPSLAQLSVPSCSGNDCCVNYLANSVTSGSIFFQTSPTKTIQVGTCWWGTQPTLSNFTVIPSSTLPQGASYTLSVEAAEAAPGGVASVYFLQGRDLQIPATLTSGTNTDGFWSANSIIPIGAPVGPYIETAEAEDSCGNAANTITTTVTITAATGTQTETSIETGTNTGTNTNTNTNINTDTST